MPRILHIINKLDIGGAEVMILDILKYANRDEFDYHILLPYGKGELDNRAESYGINLHYLDTDKSSGKLKLFRLAVKKIRELKPDLIHTHTRFSDFIGLFGGKLAGVKVRMMTIHQEGWYFLGSKPIFEGIFETFFVVRYAHHFAVISKGVEVYAKKYGLIPKTKMTLVHNGIDPERVVPPVKKGRSSLRAEMGIDEKEFVVIALGRLLIEKGFDILLNEFNKFRDRIGSGKLIIAGYGNMESELKKQAEDLGIKDQVVFYGKYDNPADLLRASDVFVHSSRIEGFGIVIIEAMATGIPVIASNVGGVPEIIEDGVDGFLFDHRQNGALSMLLERVYSHRDSAMEIGGKGKIKSHEKFHVRNTAANYENLYRRLLSRNGH